MNTKLVVGLLMFVVAPVFSFAETTLENVPVHGVSVDDKGHAIIQFRIGTIAGLPGDKPDAVRAVTDPACTDSPAVLTTILHAYSSSQKVSVTLAEAKDGELFDTRNILSVRLSK